MKFTLEISMDNAAFENREGGEVNRILEVLRQEIFREFPSLLPGTTINLRDINGNKVGLAEVRED